MVDSDKNNSSGISSNLTYGLYVQSIMVILAAIISLAGIFNMGFSMTYVTNLVSILVCISLLVYSFYGYRTKYQELYFIATILLYILLTICGLFTNVASFNSPFSLFTLITLISTIFFLHDYRKNYRSANYIMLIIFVSATIVVAYNMTKGMAWFIAFKYIIIPISIGLTYFERAQRGKYDFNNE